MPARLENSYGKSLNAVAFARRRTICVESIDVVTLHFARSTLLINAYIYFAKVSLAICGGGGDGKSALLRNIVWTY